MANASYRRILVALSVDDDVVLVEVPKHGPVVLTDQSNAHVRLRELVLDPTIPHRKGEASSTGPGDWFAEIGRQISELGREEGDPEPKRIASDDPYRRIVVALTVDGDALLVEVPKRAPKLLRAATTFATLRELVADKSIESAQANGDFNPKQFFRGAARAISELGKDDKTE
jgi:hypothetical protein